MTLDIRLKMFLTGISNIRGRAGSYRYRKRVTRCAGLAEAKYIVVSLHKVLYMWYNLTGELKMTVLTK